jgi:aspartate aminotransferase-like enzyme
VLGTVCKKIGLTLYADPNHLSDTVTAVSAPDGIELTEMLRILREEHDVILATGQGPLAGKIFRVGHLGWVPDEVINELLQKLEGTLSQTRLAPR